MNHSREVVTLAVLGAGSVRSMPAVIGSLATYFGERPLDVRFWESDSERLDLFDRFARFCFNFNQAGHSLCSTDDPAEALEDVESAILTLDENCARRFLAGNGSLIGYGETGRVLVQRAASEAMAGLDVDARVLSLVDVEATRPEWTSLNWPPEPTPADLFAMPHQILRFLNGEEYPHAFLKQYESSPIKSWLEQT